MSGQQRCSPESLIPESPLVRPRIFSFITGGDFLSFSGELRRNDVLVRISHDEVTEDHAVMREKLRHASADLRATKQRFKRKIEDELRRGRQFSTAEQADLRGADALGDDQIAQIDAAATALDVEVPIPPSNEVMLADAENEEAVFLAHVDYTWQTFVSGLFTPIAGVLIGNTLSFWSARTTSTSLSSDLVRTLLGINAPPSQVAAASGLGARILTPGLLTGSGSTWRVLSLTLTLSHRRRYHLF